MIITTLQITNEKLKCEMREGFEVWNHNHMKKAMRIMLSKCIMVWHLLLHMKCLTLVDMHTPPRTKAYAMYDEDKHGGKHFERPEESAESEAGETDPEIDVDPEAGKCLSLVPSLVNAV